MVKNSSVLVAAIAFLAAGSPYVASAQATTPPNMGSHGTTVNVFAGAASTPSESGPVAGGAVGWEITPRVGVEGAGSWFGGRDGAEAFAADLKALVNIIAARPIAPFVEGGIGLYHASFDSSSGQLPDFYEQRVTGVSGAGSRIAFTDPSFILGAGVQMFLNRHFAIRPDVEAKIVTRNSSTYVVTVFSVHMAYHFEDHPITPSRVGATR